MGFAPKPVRSPVRKKCGQREGGTFLASGARGSKSGVADRDSLDWWATSWHSREKSKEPTLEGAE
jgi:hypothetical protein